MRRRVALGLLALALAAAGCAPVGGSSGSDVPRTRCLTQPQRSQSYGADRPLFYFLCIESP